MLSLNLNQKSAQGRSSLPFNHYIDMELKDMKTANSCQDSYKLLSLY